MNCKQCNQPIAENELFCKNCGYQGPLAEQKEKHDQAKLKLDSNLISQSHSVIFLIVAICFTVMTVSQIPSIFTFNIFALIGALLPLIFMIKSTIGLWQSYTAKDKAALVKGLKNAASYDSFQTIICTIVAIVVFIVFVIVEIAIVSGGSFLMSAFGGEGEGTITVALIAFAVALIPLVIINIYSRIYANRSKYFLALSKCAEDGTYTETKAPVIGSFIIGGGSFISAILTIVLSGLASTFIGAATDAMSGLLGEFGGALDMIEGTIAASAGANIIGSISSLVFGGYYVLSAVWMSKTHKSIVEARSEVDVEAKKLEELEVSTRSAVTAYENQKVREAKAEREAAAAEAQKAQAAMQEQQNVMMQMMMQQMMANGMMPNMNGAAPAAPAAPAAEAAPAEEAPAEETTVAD